MVRRFARIAALAALVFLPTVAFGGTFTKMPYLNGSQRSLRIRFVRYTGGSSGRMVVDLKNVGKRSAKFNPHGLFFVPNMHPDKAPQRLGAAGPFEVQKGQSFKRAQSLSLKPGQTRRVALQVFCLDSHRSSPGASHKFRIGQKRLPKQLQRKIYSKSDKLWRHAKGRAAKRSAVQSHVWKSRNSKWIKIEGERKNEKSPSQTKRLRRRYRRHKRPIQQQRSID